MGVYLKSVHLKNFRGYIDSKVDFDNHLNVIIGRNDAGKSTILEALEIFLNSNQVKMELTDRNVHCSPEDKIEITCCFALDDDAKTVVDSTVPVRLDEEFLLNEDGLLEIHKTWDCSKTTIGSRDVKTYIVANYPQIDNHLIICEKIAQLKAQLKECVTPEEYESVDKTKASEVRQAIYNARINQETEFCRTEIETSQEGAKNIWNSLQDSLPLFFLFKADRLNSDKDSEVQTPMKAVTKTVVSEMKTQIDEIIAGVTEQVERIGQQTIDKLADLDPDIAKSLSPKVSVKPFESVFNFDLISDDGIPLNKRGSGVRRLILLSYFRAEAEKNVESDHNGSILYAIEEPETAQHPDFQKMIIETLQDLSNDGSHQIIITTHTPEIAKMVELDQLIFINKDQEGRPYSETENELKYKKIVDTLGILPFAAEQCVICVEGDNDVNFLNAINQIPEFKSIIDLEESRIRIIPMHGSTLINWVQSNYFEKSNIKEFHIYDNDREDYRKTAREMNQARDNRRVCHLTHRREMENYIPPKLIEEKFEIDLGEYADRWDSMDIPRLLCDKVMLNITDYKKRITTIKIILNKKLSAQITADMLREIGAYEELEALFKDIRAFIAGTYTYETNMER